MNSRHLPSPVATKIASRPTLSQFPGGPVPIGSPAARMYRQPVEPISSLKWKTLLSFGWKLIGVCRGLVLLYAILSLTHEAIDRGIIQLFGYLTNQVSISSSDRLVGTYLGWIFLAICGVGFSIPLRWVTTKMDALLSNRLRTNLFDRVLRQSPEFFHDYDPGFLNTIINQTTIDTETTLRQIIVDPILQFVVLAGTTGLVSYNFIQLHKEPLDIFGLQVPSWAIPPIIVGLALFSPYLISKRSEERRVGKECRSRWSPY